MKIKLLTLLIITSMLAACAVSPRQTPPVSYSYDIAPLPESANTYLANASQATGQQKTNYQLLASQKMLQQGNTNAASQELQRIPAKTLATTENTRYHLLKAYLALELGNPKAAAEQINSIRSVSQLDQQQQQVYYKLAYQSFFRTNQLIKAIYAQIQLSRFGQANIAELNSLWRNLWLLPNNQLQQAINNNNSKFINGWFSLALLAKQHANQTTALINAIQQWQQSYPEHPANRLLPDSNTLATTLQLNPPTKVALLLPLSGKFAQMGKAIMNGFITAYYHDNNLTTKPTLQIYDTNKQPVAQLYQQAVNQGANLIVGPMTKTNLNNLLSNVNISVPTIALNYSTNLPPNTNNLIEFGISPSQAAQQAALTAWRHGVSKILTITPNNDWGNSILQSFNQTWQNLGGQTVSSLRLNNRDLSNQIADLLQINKSVIRKDNIQKLTGRKLAFTPYRRRDANGVFLVATPDQAREIHPLLKFYFAGNLPIFATSSIYNGFPQIDKNSDLDSIYFNDMPFLLSNQTNIAQLRNQIRHNWPSNYLNYNRLFAIGIDSYTLSLLFNRLKLLPNFAINGVSGQLYLDNNQIYSQLNTARFSKGRAILINQ